jgi:hypothetical protein
MRFTPTAFHRLLEPLDRRILARTVDKHNGNHGVGAGAGAWTCQRHLKALLFAQFAGLKSLREIEQALASRPQALYHLGLRLPRRSTLSDASAARPAELFADLACHLMGMASSKLRKQGHAVVELIDTSPIPLREARFAWPEAGSRVRGLTMYVHYDPQAHMPVCFKLSSPKLSDIAQSRAMPIQSGTTYVFDKGFSDYSWWQDICEAKAVFVTRLKSNACRRDIVPTGSRIEAPILADNRIRIGHKKPRGGADNRLYDTPLREVLVERDGKAPLRLITNDFKRSAAEIAQLYKQRWQIELFFKWIKQNLRIKAFFGRSENAVRMQLYVAIIAFLLLRLFKDKYAKAHQASIKHLMARLKVALLAPLNLTDTAKPPPRCPRIRPPNPQTELAFS